MGLQILFAHKVVSELKVLNPLSVLAGQARQDHPTSTKEGFNVKNMT